MFPNRVSVHTEEIDDFGERGALLGPPDVIVGNRDGLCRRRFYLLHILDDLFKRHHVIVPVHERLIADVDRHNDVLVFVRQPDGAIDLDTVGNRVGGKFFLGDGFVQPRATFMIADLGIKPDTEQDLDRQIVFANQLERCDRVLLAVVQAEQAEIVCHENLQILEDLFAARVDGAVTAIRMLAFSKTRIGHRHDLALQQGLGFL